MRTFVNIHKRADMVGRLNDKGREWQITSPVSLKLAANGLKLSIEAKARIQSVDDKRQPFDQGVVKLHGGDEDARRKAVNKGTP